MSKHTELPSSIFAPRPNRQESKADATTTMARSILQAETTARDAKTAKLKALRLAQEAEAQPAPAKPKGRAKAAKK